MELTSMLQQYLVESRQIDALAVRQAEFICRSITGVQPAKELKIICLLVLSVLQKGSPRADRSALREPLDTETIQLHAATWAADNYRDPDWVAGLERASFQIGTLLENLFSNPSHYAPVTAAPPSGDSPWPVLVVDQNRIGFSSFWCSANKLEQEYLPQLLSDCTAPPPESNMKKALTHVFKQRSFLDNGKYFHFRQIAAAALACHNRFCILSGGPGTGKTSVVLQVLRTLLQVYPEISADRIVLCAPTGRAKARLGESIDNGLATLLRQNDGSDNEMDIRDNTLAALHRKTIHSLLGQRPDGSFKYNRDRKLPFQVVVVDESSMVPLNLFAALLDACTDNCRILLVGDMHQLPSVDAGAVLGDLTGSFSDVPGYPSLSMPVFTWIKEVIADITVDGNNDEKESMILLGADSENADCLTDHVIVLTHSYRSSKAILTLAEAVNNGDFSVAMKALRDPACQENIGFSSKAGIEPVIEWLNLRFQQETVMDAYSQVTRKYDASESTSELVDAARTLLHSSAVLTLTHDGERGRKAINQHAEQLLRKKLKTSENHRLFPGMPIILGVNHHDLDLYNGDLGIIIRTAAEGLKAIFPRGNAIQIVSLDRLRDFEPAFALTVHKAQGSEFDKVLFVLPEKKSPLLTRQIIYTAITRAKIKVHILGTEAILKKAIENREQRVGGIEIQG
ncbi:MAG: exodeoxyribonuclease V subunit alpha [Fibrobacter sp.]|nr:exodeoxyribonuclease V subunit alpha [Fibrobacter sp.]